MLRGSLKSLGSAEALLAECGIAGERRAEELTVAEFDSLAKAIRARLDDGGASIQDASRII
jgi:16S rRNA (adenine1518-N6/adenine1519-N6)-dimethyltransferase